MTTVTVRWSLKRCMIFPHTHLNPKQPCTEAHLSTIFHSTFELFLIHGYEVPPNVTQWIDPREEHPNLYSLSINARRRLWLSERLHPPLLLHSSTFPGHYTLSSKETRRGTVPCCDLVPVLALSFLAFPPIIDTVPVHWSLKNGTRFSRLHLKPKQPYTETH